MNDGGANQQMPLVHDGIMYLVNALNTVQALDAATGELIWENHVGPNQPIGFGSMRNLAIYDDKIFLATTDARLVALDARTGKVVWTTVDRRSHQGLLQHQRPDRHQAARSCRDCRAATATARNAASSAPTTRTPASSLWKFHTIARSGEPGGDTWDKLPDMMRAGGETWIVGSYDPDLDLTYWGIAQAKPWMPASRGTKVTDAALYCRVDRGAARRRRVAGLALPAHPRRVARSRRGVRARARRHRRREGRLHHRQERASCGSSIAGPASSSAHKETVFQNVFDSINPKTGVTDLSRRHPRAEDRRVDSSRVRAPKAVTTGRR